MDSVNNGPPRLPGSEGHHLQHAFQARPSRTQDPVSEGTINPDSQALALLHPASSNKNANEGNCGASPQLDDFWNNSNSFDLFQPYRDVSLYRPPGDGLSSNPSIISPGLDCFSFPGRHSTQDPPRGYNDASYSYTGEEDITQPFEMWVGKSFRDLLLKKISDGDDIHQTNTSSDLNLWSSVQTHDNTQLINVRNHKPLSRVADYDS